MTASTLSPAELQALQQQVLAIHDALLAEVLPLYKSLADAGVIELSFTPYHHPILPLLHDLAGEGTLVDGDTYPVAAMY